MKDETKSVILLAIGIGCFMFAAAFIVLSGVFGEQFHFKMTKQLEKETALLSICIHSNIVIEDCNLVYGSVDKTYGDAIR